MHVLLASKDPHLRLAIELLLDEEPGLTIVGAASETEGLLALVRTTSPDLLIVDWDLPGRPMSALLPEIGTHERPPRIIVLGRHVTDRLEAEEAGAHAYVVKGEGPERLRAAVQQVEAGDN